MQKDADVADGDEDHGEGDADGREEERVAEVGGAVPHAAQGLPVVPVSEQLLRFDCETLSIESLSMTPRNIVVRRQDFARLSVYQEFWLSGVQRNCAIIL